jgi:hypothetical protein
MNATVRVIVGAVISGFSFSFLMFAFVMIAWGWSDGGLHPKLIDLWVGEIVICLPLFLFSLWLVYRCVGSSWKLTVLSEFIGIAGFFLWLTAVVYFKQPPETLLERQTPLVEVTYLTNEVPNLPLCYPAVGTEMQDGKFNPIIFLTHESGRLGAGQKEFSMIGPKFEPARIKIFRGTNDIAAENYFLGEFEIVNYREIKEPRELWLFFSVDEKKRLFVQARAADKTHNDALKLRRVVK